MGTGDSTTAAIRPDPGTGAKSPNHPSLIYFDGDDKPDLMFTIQDGTAQPWIYWLRGKDLASQAGKYTKLSGKDVTGFTGLRSNNFGYAVAEWAVKQEFGQLEL